MAISFKKLQNSENIASLLDQEELFKIGEKIHEGYEFDEKSRKEWKEANESAMKIAKQISEPKTYPWKDAADIKYPLITQAAIDFAAREYPEIIQNTRVVKAIVVGKDPDDFKFRQANRVSQFSSYQLLNRMDDWEGGLDKLLHMLPVLGTVFKKSYYDDLNKTVCSDLCHPERIIVNYKVQSLETAQRITHILLMSKNDIVSRMRLGTYRNIDLDLLFAQEQYYENGMKDEYEIIEQQCYLDLDDDGYDEPYIVTQHKLTKQVLRIVNRFKKVEFNKSKQVARIEPRHYFTAFKFLQSPDGGFYGTGLGTLLLPLNRSINSILNQLIDAGTLSNTQGGFIDSKVRLKNGDMNIKGGEFKVVQVSGMNKLADYISPLPTKEPSGTLFQLLGLLISASKDLVSNTDILKGKGQTQNVPATTTMAMINQGLTIYNAITKRLFLALGKEYQKIYELNQMYLSNDEYQEVLDDPEADVSVDFNLAKLNIVPVADPSAATESQRLARAQTLLSLPGLNPYEAQKYFLESMGLDQEVIQKLLPQPDPNAPPPPEAQKLMAETQKLAAEAAKTQMETQILPTQTQLDIVKSHQDAKESDSRIQESQGRIGKMAADAAHNNGRLQLESVKIHTENDNKQGQALLEHATQAHIAQLKSKEVEDKVMQKYQQMLNAKLGENTNASQ